MARERFTEKRSKRRNVAKTRVTTIIILDGNLKIAKARYKKIFMLLLCCAFGRNNVLKNF